MAPEVKLVHPEAGVKLYVGGKHATFEPGRAVPLPADHADELVAAGHVRHHADATPAQTAAIAPPAAPAPAAVQSDAAPDAPASEGA